MVTFRSKEISTDFEEELDSLICRADKIVYEMSNSLDDEDSKEIEEVFVVDDKNNCLLYSVAREDLIKLEDEFLRLGTYFIDKFEQARRYVKADQQRIDIYGLYVLILH